MKVFILGGMGDKNLPWSEKLSTTISERKGYKSDFQMYQHWIDNKEGINFELEQSRFIEHVNTLWNNYCLICKSVGVILFLKSIDRFIIKPKQVILCGINLELVKKFDAEIRNFDFPVTLLQNPGDPAGRFEEIVNALKDIVNWEFVEGEGDTHAYDISLILKELA